MVASNFHTQALEASEPSQMTIDPVTALDRPVGTPMAPRVATRHSHTPVVKLAQTRRDVPQPDPLPGIAEPARGTVAGTFARTADVRYGWTRRR
jgi:hypothetical protein